MCLSNELDRLSSKTDHFQPSKYNKKHVHNNRIIQMQDRKGRITVMQCWNMALYLVSNTCNFYLCPCTCSTFIHTATAHSLRVLLPTLQTKAINHIGFNDNVNIWDSWEFTTLIMADRDTVTSVCDYVFLLSALSDRRSNRLLPNIWATSKQPSCE